MTDQIRFVENETISKGTRVVLGLPDVGLVGLLAVSELITCLKMNEVGLLESELFPPITVLHDGVPKSPFRIFSKDSLAAIIAETAIPVPAIRPLADAIVNWAASREVGLLLCVGGMSVQNRHDLDSPKVFAALSDKRLASTLNDAGEVLTEGYIVGAYALILRRCMQDRVNAIALLTQSFYNYPDPEAAAAAVTALNQILKLQVDVSRLITRGEEIRLKTRDMMRRTHAEMARMEKSQELDIPPLYA